MLKSFDDLIEKAAGASGKTVAIVCPEDRQTVEAAVLARNHGICKSLLVGKRGVILDLLKEIGEDSDGFTVYDGDTPEEAAALGVRLVNQGKADFVMKGNLGNWADLRAVLNKENGLNVGGIMSHIAMQTVPRYHKMLVTTDGGMLPYPTLEQKKAIVNNAVSALRALGYDRPKVGILASVEEVNPKMPETVDGAALKEMNQKGEIKNCVVEGPISLDLALVKERAVAKGYESEVAGDADILVAPNVHAGNILGKALIEMAGGKMAGVILGAKAPVGLTSRASSTEEKYYALALAAAIAGRRMDP